MCILFRRIEIENKQQEQQNIKNVCGFHRNSQLFTVHSEAIDGKWIRISVSTSISLLNELFDWKSIDFKFHFITFQIEIALWFCYAMTIARILDNETTPPALDNSIIYLNQIRSQLQIFSIEVWPRENANFPIKLT